MVLASGLLAVVVAAAFTALLLAIDDLRETERLAAHSQEVLAVANSLERLVVDLETGQRGYLITRDERFLEPWDAARAAIPAAAGELNRLAAVPAQDRRARRIGAAVASYVRDYSIPLVEAARRGDPAARSVALTTEGRQRVDEIRGQFTALVDAEQRLSVARRDQSDTATTRAVVGATVGLAGSILLVVLYAGYLTRAIIRPVRRAAGMADRLAGGDLAARMQTTGIGEIGVLERSFNAMAGSLQEHRDELAELAAEQAALRRVATLVARRASAAELFTTVAEEMGERLGAEITKVLRLEPDGAATVVGGWSVPGLHIPMGTRLAVEEDGVAATIRRSGRPTRTDRFEGPPGSIGDCFRGLGVESGVGSPIVVERRLWGVAIAASSQPLPPGSENRIADFTELVATAIANADSRAELAASRARIVSTADETRRRIERDLHDGAQQRLVSLGLRLRAAESVIPPELDHVQQELSRVGTDLDAVLDDLREMSRGIHPAILSEGGLGPALKGLARRSSVPVVLHAGAAARLPEPVEVAAYYVVSEALANVAKHASASSVEVDVEQTDGLLRLSIRDDGVGGADPSAGSGLIGLKDRVEAIGGTFEVKSRVGAGTSLLVELPVSADSG
jgi:signal transduction histidine kinase